MTLSANPLELYSKKSGTYEFFIHSVGYPQGLRAYFAQSPLIRPGLRVLDAGCGTGVVSLAVRNGIVRHGFLPAAMHAFDLTPAMLERFRDKLTSRGIADVELTQCNVLALEKLPAAWSGYDLIVSASMMEYLTPDELRAALSGLRARLAPAGTLVLFMSRRNWVMRPLIGAWWQSNLYTAPELRAAFRQAGFGTATFKRFPSVFRYLEVWGHIVEARV